METRYSCLIVDDEYPAHDVIQALLANHPSLEFKKSLYNGEDALKEMQENHYDLVFLDIDMPLMNGIEVISKLDTKPTIIITTAYTHFAFEAYQHEAIDYLQKPISPERFEKGVMKALEACKKRKDLQEIMYEIKVNGMLRIINAANITHIRSMGNYSKLAIKNEKSNVLVYETLTNQLSSMNHENFIQIHRTCAVNKEYIKSRILNELILKDGTHLPIGRKYMDQVLKLVL